MSKISDNKIAKLIEELTPLNNQYRDFVLSNKTGGEVLEIMWRIGKILEDFVNKEKIKPHNLYWQIYGKAPGLKKSYITRDFLSYCLRIKKFFNDINDIKQIFPNLKKYSLFREAFPLLENPRYKLQGQEYYNLIELLNSETPASQIKSSIRNLKNNIISIHNPRTQRLSELQNDVNNFNKIINQVEGLLKKGTSDDLAQFRYQFSPQLITELSQYIAAFTQEGLRYPELKKYSHLPDEWIDCIHFLQNLSQGNIETRNRFRRLVPPKILMEVAGMLDAILDDKKVKEYRLKKGLILKQDS